MTNLSAVQSGSDRAAPMGREQASSQEARRRQLKSYLDHGLRNVSGWLDKRSAKIIAALGDYQSAEGIRGALGEIGVHHGKLFILLDLMRAADETSFAIDCSTIRSSTSNTPDWATIPACRRTSRPSPAERTASRSSRRIRWSSERARFSRSAGPPGYPRSTEVTPPPVRRTTSVFRRARRSTKGIVIVDDYFNPLWPDVSIGVSQYMFDGGSKLRPFAVSPNKLYLARSDCHGRYRAVLRDRVRRYFLKTSEMYGQEVDIYGYDRSSSWRRRVINYVKKSPVGGPAHALYQHYRALTGP